MNIVNNAMKFTPDGGMITVRVDRINGARGAIAPQGSFLRIAVQDTGVGIPVSACERIFDKFHQVRGHTKNFSGTKGTGLGLAIAKGIVEAHGGSIWVESEEGRGSTFYVTLPVTKDTCTA
jgi:two-component system sensor histidine kinase VicK